MEYVRFYGLPCLQSVELEVFCGNFVTRLTRSSEWLFEGLRKNEPADGSGESLDALAKFMTSNIFILHDPATQFFVNLYIATCYYNE